MTAGIMRHCEGPAERLVLHVIARSPQGDVAIYSKKQLKEY